MRGEGEVRSAEEIGEEAMTAAEREGTAPPRRDPRDPAEGAESEWWSRFNDQFHKVFEEEDGRG